MQLEAVQLELLEQLDRKECKGFKDILEPLVLMELLGLLDRKASKEILELLVLMELLESVLLVLMVLLDHKVFKGI